MSTRNLNLLLVEDDLDLAVAVIDYLELEDITCDHATNGEIALNLIQANRYDVILLDLNIPKIDGLQVCSTIRHQGIDTPVLMLTARDTLDDKLTGFSTGADDYLVKPFAMEELIARSQVLARRRSGEVTYLQVADLSLDLSSKHVSRSGRVLKLSPIAVKILEKLMRESPNPVSRDEIIQAVWGDQQPESNSLKVHIFNLRKQIDGNEQSKLLSTVSGYGFVLKE